MPPAPDKPVVPANHRSRTLTARPTASETPGNLEAARLMTQARLLLDLGNIIAARSVLERAAESGSAQAPFLLAETYDRAILSEWVAHIDAHWRLNFPICSDVGLTVWPNIRLRSWSARVFG
jgi:hypothetical protein